MANSGPRVASSPLELLENDTTRELPLLTKVFGPLFGGALGFTACIVGNNVTRKPIFSGLQKHVFFTIALAAVGKFVEDYRRDYFAERDAIFRHYVQLHPEDFPPYERVQYKNVFEPWIPIR